MATQKEIAVQMAIEVINNTKDNAYIIKSRHETGMSYEVLTRDDWKNWGSDLYGCTQDPNIEVTVMEANENQFMTSVDLLKRYNSYEKLINLSEVTCVKLSYIESFIKQAYINGTIGEVSGKIFLSQCDFQKDYWETIGEDNKKWAKTHKPAVDLVHGGIVLVRN